MPEQPQPGRAVAPGALDGARVVELGHGVAGPYAARLLGDLGAEVVKVEPPAKGEVGRRLGPAAADVGGAGAGERAGLLFEFLNWNKRGLCLDLAADGAAETLRPLVERTDIVVDSLRPGRLEQWGLGPDRLREWNPRLVVTSVTNFGRTGPRAQWQASDLVFYAMSGVMHMSGEKWPREPIKHGLRQSLYCAGLNAAYISLLGYFNALRTGVGTHVDLSIQEVVASEQITPLSYYIFTGLVNGRNPQVQDPFGGDPIELADGRVSLQAPPACPPVRYADFLGIDLLRDPKYVPSEGRIEDAALIRRAVEEKLAGWSAKDFFVEGSKQGLIVALVQNAAALLGCEQLAERGLFRPLPGRGGGPRIRVPVELARLDRTPVSVRRPAPRLGEHNEEILEEISSPSQIRPAPQSPAAPGAAPGGAKPFPLRGLRVVDLSNIVAGPYMGGLLADLGADVVKVEGPGRLDPARVTWGPLVDNDPGAEPWNRGGAFQVLNRGKRSLVCDLAAQEGRDLLCELLAVSDVLIENFTPRVLRGWGLTPEALAELNPRLITVSNSGYGATGPWRDFKAQGTTLEVLMGISHYSGYRGGRPVKIGQSYPDFIACWSGMVALFAALVERERTGRGQWIDQGMYQVGAALIPEAYLQVQSDGTDPGRCGAEDFDSVLSGVFPTCEHDVWLAVSLADLAQLEAVALRARRNGLPEPALDHGGDPEAARRALADWIGRFAVDELAELLQSLGIAAGRVMSTADLLEDEHLLRRGFYEPVDFGDGAPRPVIGRPYKFDNLDARIGGRAPRFGEHNAEVLDWIGPQWRARAEELHERGVLARDPLKPGGARKVRYHVMTGPSGSFSAAHEDYLERLRARRRAADALTTTTDDAEHGTEPTR